MTVSDDARKALEVARFEMEQVGAIGTMEDGAELITMGVLLSGDEAAIKWAGQHIFSSVVLMRATDHAALLAEIAAKDAALAAINDKAIMNAGEFARFVRDTIAALKGDTHE